MTPQSFKLAVSCGHVIHIELSGNRHGIPVLFLHGGPGAGINQNYQTFFDLSDWFVIAFDQRGCGQSIPFADIENNTTQLTIEDIERLREHLNINKWYVFGGSWGATLGLLYAIEFPQRTLGLVLRGVFLAREEDISFFISRDGAAANLFPEEYHNFINPIKNLSCTKEICKAYFELMSSQTEKSREATKQWFDWELSISRVRPERQDSKLSASEQQIKTLALFECFYLLNHCFIKENYILDNIERIRSHVCYIIHGRHDLICKPKASYDLHKVMPNSVLHIIENAGHSSQETGIKKQLIDVMKKISNLHKGKKVSS